MNKPLVTDRLAQTMTALARLVEEAMNDIHTLDSEFQETVAETDEAAAIALERQIATAVERVRAELIAQFEAERAMLIADRNRAQQRLAELATEYEQSSGTNAAVQAEISRIETMIHEIRQVVEDPDTELSIVIRKNVERAELESYLKGLRFTSASK